MRVELTWVELAAERAATPTPRVAVLELGDPTGPPIVLVPGLTDALHPVWAASGREPFADLPVPMERCRGLVISYRDPLAGARSTRDLAGDLAVTLRSRLAQPAVLIGHSLGTLVAQHLVADAPELVAGLVLSAPLWTVDDELRAVLDRWAEMVRDGRWTAMAADALACSYTGSERDRRRELLTTFPPEPAAAGLVERHLQLTQRCRVHRPPPSGTGDVPTLLLAGEQDPVAPPRHARALAAAGRATRLHVLPGLAHGFPEQAPAAFGTFVTTFLGEVATACPSWRGTAAADPARRPTPQQPPRRSGDGA